MELKALEKHEFELCIKTQLMTFEISNEKEEKDKNCVIHTDIALMYLFHFVNLPI